MPIYALTTFLSAFLLFSMQPMIAKFLLPWFGGSAGVWTTCMMFFQTLLLAGYAYAHLLTRFLAPRRQAIVHSTLLIATVVTLHILPGGSGETVSRKEPVPELLMILLKSVSLPFFVLSSTAPLVQRWVTLLNWNHTPYRLYALSNAASLIALLSYPFLIEPHIPLRTQTKIWEGVFIAFSWLCTYCAFRVPAKSSAPPAFDAANVEGFKPKIREYFLWTGLAAAASILLLATTNHLCHDIASVPFLWVLPLSLYLLSFVVSFDHSRWYHRGVFAPAFVIAAGLFAYAVHHETSINLPKQILMYGGALFVFCMVCHGELYRIRPAPRYLTSFYLSIALGGALGGVFVSVIAPRIFNYYIEFPIAIVACCVLVLLVYLSDENSPLYRGRRWWASALALTGIIALAAFFRWQHVKDSAGESEQKRNFYGVISLVEKQAPQPPVRYRKLMSGTIIHGMQLLDAGYERWPTTYYAKYSGIERAIRVVYERGGNLHFGGIGLGTGTIATFMRKGDTLRFYEINPAVIGMAYRSFKFLKMSPAKIQVILGDARMSMQREAPNNFDLLALDAFSGDAIPVHLLTKEAFAVYQQHIASNGVIAVHVSNRYLNLVPIVRKLGESIGMSAVVVSYNEDKSKDQWWRYASTWVLLTRDETFLASPLIQDLKTPLKALDGTRIWTDDYVALFDVLKM